jgi:hypothetical protein
MSYLFSIALVVHGTPWNRVLENTTAIIPIVHYLVRKNPRLVPILCQMNLVHSPKSYIIQTHVKIIPSSSLLPSGFPTTILKELLIS